MQYCYVIYRVKENKLRLRNQYAPTNLTLYTLMAIGCDDASLHEM